jgi:hypothetical protein
MLLAHATNDAIPHKVAALDVGAFTDDRGLLSLRDTDEFFLATEFAAGVPYVQDLERIVESGVLEPRDVARAERLADYLVALHAHKQPDRISYLRRVRDLIWGTHLERSGDNEMVTMVQPFLAWRTLALAHPVWYPTIPEQVRESLFQYVEHVLQSSSYDPTRATERIG